MRGKKISDYSYYQATDNSNNSSSGGDGGGGFGSEAMKTIYDRRKRSTHNYQPTTTLRIKTIESDTRKRSEGPDRRDELGFRGRPEGRANRKIMENS